MGRAIVREPHVFLMDEPLSNLDAKLRVATRAEIATLQRTLGVTTLYVTHDQVEAMTMGDRVAVMKDGLLQQCDAPRALYERPVNAFVAGFIGSPPMNLVQGSVEARGVRVGSTVISVTGLPKPIGDPVTVGLRPEALALAAPGDGIPAVVRIVEDLGAESFLHVELANGADNGLQAKTNIVARIEPHTTPGNGELVHLRVKDGSMLFFDAETGLAIPT